MSVSCKMWSNLIKFDLLQLNFRNFKVFKTYKKQIFITNKIDLYLFKTLTNFFKTRLGYCFSHTECSIPLEDFSWLLQTFFKLFKIPDGLKTFSDSFRFDHNFLWLLKTLQNSFITFETRKQLFRIPWNLRLFKILVRSSYFWNASNFSFPL